jgi:hypothetical protein
LNSFEGADDMTNQDIHSVRDIGAKSFGEARAPMSRPAEATREPVIQIRAYRRPGGSEEASSPDDDVPVSIGELAVRLVARFTLPRMKMLPPSREGDDGSAR